jgi:hypothetical protein
MVMLFYDAGVTMFSISVVSQRMRTLKMRSEDEFMFCGGGEGGGRGCNLFCLIQRI